MKNIFAFLFFLIALLPFSSIADTTGSYTTNLDLNRPKKESVGNVDIFLKDEVLSRPNIILGNFSIESDGTQTTEDLWKIARTRAADLGADYVQVKSVTARNKIKKHVGGVAFVGVSLSSETEAQSIPKMVFAFGVYNKSTVGLVWDKEPLKNNSFIVASFRSFSVAEKAGLKIGDEVLELNGMLMSDKRIKTFFVDVEPGTIVKMFVKREGKTFNIDIPTVQSI